ncbi:MAG: IPT/TIG domain-containing protein, partial [Candidatus Dormibacteraeota bacterium]|nr:IPT/TIG domain-containing protein [Candidatus Dormibacteraeota bacterium]
SAAFGVDAVTGFSPPGGPVGTTVTITGSGFDTPSAATAVSFNGTSQPTFTVVDDGHITANVPTGATQGPIGVTTAGGAVTSSSSFTVGTAPATAHVMVVLLENRGYAATLGTCANDPNFCSLASTYASLTSWHSLAHPSLPDYLALVSGSTQGCTSDSCKGPYTGAELGGQLTAAGIPWTAYMESMPSPCYTQGFSGTYVKRHDPFLYFNDVLNNGCANDVLPYPGSSAMVSALTAPGAPDFVWITPDLNDDMHKGTIQQGDAWLQANIAPVLSSPWFTSGNATVIVTMDEGLYSDATNQVPTVVISRNAQGKGNVSTPSGNHYGLLRSIEEAFGLTYLGAAADPTNGDISGLFG